MQKTAFETTIGAIVVITAIFFVVTAYKNGNQSDVDQYQIKAQFNRVDGLQKGGEVRLSGLIVGKVSDQTINPETYQAEITLSIDETIKLPKDTSAEIIGDGLLGSKYVALVPGASEEYLQSGDKIRFTQSAVSLESLIGKFVFGGAEDQEEKAKKPAKDGKDSGAAAEDEDDIFNSPF